MGARVAIAVSVVAFGLLCSTLWAQGRGGIASFPAQQRDPADPALVARGRSTYDTECRFCHGPDLRGGERGGSNLLRSPLVLNDREGESIQTALQGSHKDRLSAAASQRRRHEGTGCVHSQRARAGARAGRSSSRTGCRAQGARRRCRGRRAVFRHEVRELSLGDGRSEGHWRAGSRTCSASESLDCRRTRRGRRPRWTRCGRCCSGSADDHAA